MHIVIALSFLLTAACSKDVSSKKDDSLGSCVVTVKPGVPHPPNAVKEACLEHQPRADCTSTDSLSFSHSHATCASYGFTKTCAGTSFPAGTLFKVCPSEPKPAYGSCLGSVKPGIRVPPGAMKEGCLDNQLLEDCRPSDRMDWTPAESTCASRGFAKRCDGGTYPASARFKTCPANTIERT